MGLWPHFLAHRQAKKAIDKGVKLIARTVSDEEYQNQMLPSITKEAVIAGIALDMLPNATGPFGLVVTNPIPVNGPVGEIAYLSNLDSVAGGHLLFHRLGSINLIDVYETVSITGRHWELLFLDFYHPRKSSVAPVGYRVGRPRQFTGFHSFCKSFPYDFAECKDSTPGMLRLAYAPTAPIQRALQEYAFDRPISHARKVSMIGPTLTFLAGLPTPDIVQKYA